MNEWLDEFYGDDLRGSLIESLGPLFAAYALEVWRAEGGQGTPPEPFVRALAEAYADHHIQSSRIQLQEVVTATSAVGGAVALEALRQRFGEWAEKRPEKVANNETVRTGNAIALERMRSEGVTRKVWASSGGSCPFCSGLDGRTVEVERDFFTPDDTYQPEGADEPLTFTSSIGHPPIHQGCDCSIVAG